MTKKEFIELIKDAPDDSTLHFEIGCFEKQKYSVERVLILNTKLKSTKIEINNTQIVLR